MALRFSRLKSLRLRKKREPEKKEEPKQFYKAS